MKAIVKAITKANLAVGSVTSFLVYAMIAVLCFEVVMRYIFSSPTNWAYAMATIFYGIFMMLGGGYAAVYKAHVRMDLLYTKLSRKGKSIIDIITFPFSMIFFIPYLAACWEFGIQAAVTGEVVNQVFSYHTMWVKLGIAVAATLLTLQIIAKLLEDIYFLAKGKEMEIEI